MILKAFEEDVFHCKDLPGLMISSKTYQAFILIFQTNYEGRRIRARALQRPPRLLFPWRSAKYFISDALFMFTRDLILSVDELCEEMNCINNL